MASFGRYPIADYATICVDVIKLYGMILYTQKKKQFERIHFIRLTKKPFINILYCELIISFK